LSFVLVISGFVDCVDRWKDLRPDRRWDALLPANRRKQPCRRYVRQVSEEGLRPCSARPLASLSVIKDQDFVKYKRYLAAILNPLCREVIAVYVNNANKVREQDVLLKYRDFYLFNAIFSCVNDQRDKKIAVKDCDSRIQDFFEQLRDNYPEASYFNALYGQPTRERPNGSHLVSLDNNQKSRDWYFTLGFYRPNGSK